MAINWFESMRQTYEFCIVDPETWLDSAKIDTVESCNILHDTATDTKYSGTLVVGDKDIGETYLRVYLSCIQGDQNEKFPLATFMAQSGYDTGSGTLNKYSVNAYSPLLELKDDLPPFGYSILKDRETPEAAAYHLATSYSRVNMINPGGAGQKINANFIADPNDDILTVQNKLLDMNDEFMDVDEMGRCLVNKYIEFNNLQPVWVFRDDSSSILYPEFEDDFDYYGVPNVVEVIYSGESGFIRAEIQNNNRNNRLSIPRRGRIVRQRIVNPEFIGEPTSVMVDQYARKVMSELTTVQKTVVIRHAFCGVRAGECVLLDYQSKGLHNVKAKIVRQSIECAPGTPVESTCVYNEVIGG